MNRRTLLKNSLGITLLSLGGVSAYQVYRQSLDKRTVETEDQLLFLSSHDVIVLQALVPVMLSTRLIESKISVARIIGNMDSAIVRLPLPTQAELRELFDLLGHLLGRLLVANIWLNWSSADKQSIDSFLSDWRNSHLNLLQIAYKGLHKLIIASYYAQPASWRAIGYSGPPAISLG